MTSGEALSRREKGAMAGVFGLALVARLISMAIAFDSNLKFEKYFDLARQLIANGWRTKEAFAYAPGYVYFMAVLLRLGTSPTVICLVQIILGSLTCVFIYFITRRLFDPRVALVAGIMAALYGPFLTYDIEFLSDSFGTFLYCAAALALLRALAKPSFAMFAVSGLLVGLRAIQRPNVLLLIPLCLLIVFFTLHLRHGIRRTLAWSAALVAAMLAPILPITIQNCAATKEFILITDSGGYVFYCSNNHGSRGLRYNPPGLVAREMQRDPKGKETRVDLMDDALSQEVAGRVEGRTLSPKESSRFWLNEGLKCIRRRGVGQLGLWAKKLFYMFHAYRSHDTFPVLVKDEKLGRILFFGMGIVSPFALVGMIITRRKWRDLLLGYALVLTPVASMMIFYVASRFRLGLGAMLIPFAAAGVLRIVDRFRVGKARKAVLPLAGLLALLIGVHWPDSLIVQQTRAQEINRRLYQGHIARDSGRVHDAMAEYQAGMALAKYPGEASRCVRALAEIYRRMGDVAEAGRLRRSARGALAPRMVEHLQSLPKDFDARFALGQHFFVGKKYKKAVEQLSKAAELDPFNAVARFRLAQALFAGKLASSGEIVSHLEKSLEYGLRFSPSASQAYVLIARCHCAEETWQAAIGPLQHALRYSPGNGHAHALLANALLKMGRRTAAEKHATRARELGCEKELAPELRE